MFGLETEEPGQKAADRAKKWPLGLEDTGPRLVKVDTVLYPT